MLKIKPFLLQEIFVRPIWESRALLQLKHSSLRQVQSARDLAVTLPHYIYTLGLDDIVQDRVPGTPTALRALEVQGNQAQAFFDLTPDERFPQVRQMSGPSPYLDRLNRALGVAARHAASVEPEAELRMIQVPALHLDALTVGAAGAPYLCGFMDAITLTHSWPYEEINDYLRLYPERATDVRATLNYFDGINFAPRIRCPMLLYVGLGDDVCPPETGYALYNALECLREIHAYPRCAHDSGAYWEMAHVQAFLAKHLRPGS